MKNHSYAVILAGGAGTRFWPMSRFKKPKQFLLITGKKSLLQETVERVLPMIPAKNIYIITNKSYQKQIRTQLSIYKVPSANILLEPSGKNTAPAICWASVLIHERDPQATLFVFPSDHLIQNKKEFLAVLQKAGELAAADYLVTLGIVPTRPETGYGYLQTAQRKDGNREVMIVSKFTEKPSLEKAKEFIQQNNFLWNSGMFIWRSEVILKEFEKYLPDVYAPLKSLKGKNVQKVWNKIPSISIDYGILEKASKVAAVPAADIGWSDLGSWESLTDVLPKDAGGNIQRGDVLSLNCKNTLVWSNKKLIAVVGLENLLVIDTDDALLICPKNQSQSVKDIVNELKKNKRREL